MPSLTDLLFARGEAGLCLVAPDGTILRANQQWLRSTGFSLDDVLGADVAALFPEPRDVALALYARAWAGHHVDVPRHARRIEGRETWWEGCIDPVPMEGGPGLLITAREVTKERVQAEPEAFHHNQVELEQQNEELRSSLQQVVRAEEVLRQEKEKYRALFEHSLDAVYLTLADGTFVDANAAACRMHGMTIEEIKERRCGGTVVRDERYAAALKQRAATGSIRAELTHLRKDGTTFPVEVESVKLDPQRPDSPAFIIARDISDRKRAEEALRDTEERLRAAFEASPDAININRMRDGIYVAVNDGFTRLTGWSREDALGKTAEQLNVWVDAEHGSRLMERLRRGESIQNAETSFRRKDGSVLTASISGKTFTAGGEGFLLAITRDISEMKRAESALREADRRKDEFLAMLSHELRNPLAPIRNAAYILERVDPNGEQAQRARGVLCRQSEHLTRLVDDLLDVTRITRGRIGLQRSRIDLREVVLRAADDVRPTMAECGIAFRTVLPEREVWAHADATRLNQVVSNLLNNAAKFTEGGDEVTVTLGAEGGTAEIRVRDTGAGIDATVLPRLFGAFVQAERTLARSEGGLGLGLALVKGIVELHGGTVRAESAGIGKGAEFIVRLPIAEAPVITSEVAPIHSGARAKRVLIVDDNRDAAESLADILRMLGHEAEVAHDGPSALAKLGARAPDAVLCDIGLPGMDGYEVAKAMRAAGRRAVKLVALTGYAQEDDVKHAMEAGFDAHVAKPPNLGEIARLLA